MPLLADELHNSRQLRFWATLIHWLLPKSSMLIIHLILDLPPTRFPFVGVHSDVILFHLVLLILATCPAHCPVMHRTHSIIPPPQFCISLFHFESCLSSRYLRIISPCFVEPLLASSPDFFLIEPMSLVHMSQLVRLPYPWLLSSGKQGSFYLPKSGYTPKFLSHPDVILWTISLLISLPIVANLPKY